MLSDIEVCDGSIVRPTLRKGLMITGAAVIGALAWVIVQNPRGPITICVIGIVLLIGVSKLWQLTRRDPIWLGFPLMLLELLGPCFFLSDRTRPIATYGLTLLFCAPALPILLQAWKVPKSGFRGYLIYFGWCLVTVTYSLSPKYSFSRLFRSVLVYAAITLCSLRARQTGEARRVIRCLMLATIVVTLGTALVALVLPHSITWGNDLLQNGPQPDDTDAVDRFQGPFDNPSRLGELALVTVGLIMTYFDSGTKKERVLLTVSAVIAVVLTAMADSRSGLMALAFGSSLYALWKYRLKGLAVVAVGLFIVVIGVISAGPTIAPYIWRGDVWTVTGRTDIWPFAVRAIANKPITGHGYQVAGAIFESRFFQVWWGPYNEGAHSSVHNGYLAQMVSVGIPAFVFWMFITLRPWISLFKSEKDEWRIKRIFFFIVVPALLVNLDEEMIGDCLGPSGLLFTMVWAIAEQYRLSTIRRNQVARREALQNLSAASAALLS
jgi:O-Antigen ligase